MQLVIVDIDEPRTDRSKVEEWRLETLLAAGYPLELAEKLANDSRVDLHQAVKLVTNERRCSPDLAAEILL